ncbi:MAG: DUF998 domain-containing protein [Zestosphaera sp.]
MVNYCKRSMTKYTCYSGLLSFAISYIFIAWSISVNPWFSLFRNALSDLGRVGLDTAYIFNSGLMLAALIAFTYLPCLLEFFNSRIGHMTVGVFLVAMFHLLLIGVFPEGTSPHGFVSYEFFVLMTVTMFLTGISLAVEGMLKYGFLLVLVFILSLLGSTIIKWPSVSLLELYNIFLYNIGVAVLTYLQITRHR